MLKAEQKIKNLESEINRLRSAVNELKLLNEIAVAAGRSADIGEMLQTILHKCISAVGAEQGTVSLVSENKEDSFKTFLRRDDLSSLKHNFHIGSNITGLVLLNKEPLIIEDLKKDKRFSPSEEELRDIKSVLCVPIWHEGKITGIMQMINKKDGRLFTQEDLTLLSIISVQVGQMIKNLTLQKEAFEKKNEAELARIESEKLIELDKAKSDFFANITHEFRTPLTLIMGPAKKLMKRAKTEENANEFSRIIRSSERLLNLVNQILDLSKLESGTEKLSVAEGNISACAAAVVRSFYPAAESKNIELGFGSDPKNIAAYFDEEKIRKILGNLLSNAFKFTHTAGKISVAVASENSGSVKIQVSDTGIGIPAGQLDKIFGRFFRVEKLNENLTPGTGIGLALVKQLAELHRGKISVESSENKGSVFTFTFPSGKNSYAENEISIKVADAVSMEAPAIETEIPRDRAEVKDKNGAPLILVIEDNPDVREYIVENLRNKFSVIESPDGNEGWNKALESIPDLIISDICMPGMDGIELCSRLKTDERTSHIPVVLLTAKADEKCRFEGLETGADDYITKPFDFRELEIRIGNLIAQRKNLRRRFSSQITLQPKDIAVTPADEKFLRKLMAIIDENISDPSLNVNELSSRLCMSRVQLFRKIKALTDQSVVEFIRSMRLKRALKLLEGSTGNISEIAYEVGFGNPAYFSECFKKQFGKVPSEYIHSLKAAENKA